MGGQCVQALVQILSIQWGSNMQKYLPQQGLHSSGGSSPKISEQNGSVPGATVLWTRAGSGEGAGPQGRPGMVLAQRLEGGESQVHLWGKSSPGRGKGQCKGPVAGMSVWPESVLRAGSRSHWRRVVCPDFILNGSLAATGEQTRGMGRAGRPARKLFRQFRQELTAAQQ